MADPIESIPIPSTPPTSSGATQGAVAGIAAIIAACDAAGLKSKYAKCALLGVAGVESKWLYSALEDHTYSTKGIRGTWPRIKQPDAEHWNNKPNQYSRVEFFGFIYGTSKNKPASIGNYHGRGFIQITFPEAYKAIGDKLGIDLVGNPDLVASSADIGGKVMVEFVKWKMKDWETRQWSSGFFDYLLSKVGGDANGWPVKRKYYEYFLGGKSDSPPTNKDPSSTSVNKTAREIDLSNPNKREAYTEDRSANFNTEGFTDPEGKYPLRDFMNEPDTNRLARGIIDGTHVKFKDITRKLDIPIANMAGGTGEQGTWDQPECAYNTVYPFNKVFESEAGHVLEFDDSPDGERVNIYHSKGTFIEIDPNGSQINYIVGDGFYITENNGNVFINGTCNITVASELNILCQGNANIEVNGTADVVIHDDLNIGVAKDLNIAVGGDYNVLVEGNYNVEVAKTSNTRSIGTMSIESTDALKLKTAKTMSMEGGDTASTAETLMKMSSSFKLETPADFQIKAKTFTLDIEDSTEIKTKTFLLQTEETTKIKTDMFQLDGTTSTDILTGMFNTTTTMGILQLNSTGTAIINANATLSATAGFIDLNGTAIPPTPITAISDKVEPLVLLGAPKVPVDFAGDPVKDRKEEQVLVDTVLNPAGEYNPNTLSKSIIEYALTGIPFVGGIAPDIYDVKYTGAPIENKTSLTSSGASVSPYSKLQVPPSVGSNKPPQNNLKTPERHSESTSKYETEADWASSGGQKLEHKISSTSDYEHNHVDPTAEDSTTPSGGKSGGTDISQDKLNDINGRGDFPLSYPLSKHFTLGMLCKDGNLQEQTIAGTLYTKANIVANLSELCENLLEKIYDELGPCQGGGNGATWRISDGFRPNNRANSKGSKTSHHLKGRAADIQLVTPNKISDLYDLCVKLEKILPYQECFMEYANGGKSRWIHLAYDKNNSSKEVTTQVEWKKKSNKIEKLFS
jgi:predicted chitinase